MNKLSSFALILAAASVFVTSSAHAASARENQRLHQGKITKNEAEHLVLKQYPHATIKNCQLTAGKNHSVWVMDVMKSGSQSTMKVRVDGHTGKILP